MSAVDTPRPVRAGGVHGTHHVTTTSPGGVAAGTGRNPPPRRSPRAPPRRPPMNPRGSAEPGHHRGPADHRPPRHHRGTLNPNPKEHIMSGDTAVTLVGNLTADPELRLTQSGVPVADSTVASRRTSRDRGARRPSCSSPRYWAVSGGCCPSGGGFAVLSQPRPTSPGCRDRGVRV